MIALIVLNAIALLCGFAGKTLFMYILFGIAWLAFSHKYAKFIWTWVYERFLLEWETAAVLVDLEISNVVVTVILMAGVYIGIYEMLGGVCIFLPAVQCLIFQGVSVYREPSEKNKLLLAGFVLELLPVFFVGK